MLTQQEIQILAQLIDASSRKGLFGAQDLAVMGQLHNKLISMLQGEPKNTVDTAKQEQ